VEKQRTIRFTALVQKFGKPDVVTLWTDPKNDKHFMDAVKHNRVLTVAQRHRGKKDVGEVGFHAQSSAEYLVFPKRLSGNDGVRVVGIDYDLLESAPPPRKWKPKILKSPPPKPVAPTEIHFTATVSRTLKQEFTYDIKAASPTAARKEALNRLQMEELPPKTKKLSLKISRLDPKD